MSDIRVLGLEAHYINPAHPGATSGVDFARIINPMTHLAKVPGFHVEIRKNPFTKKDKDWETISKNWDIIYTSYVDSDWGYVQMAMWQQKYGTKVVMDLDDNIWDVHPTSNVYKHYHKGSPALFKATAIMTDCSYLTTTNIKLKYKMMQETGKSFNQVKIFPNYIDPEVYDYKKIIPHDHDTVNIFWFGSGTHYMDLVHSPFTQGVDKLLKKYPNVKMYTVGAFLPELKTRWMRQYEYVLGEPDVYQFINKLWPKIMGMGDIFTAPILEGPMTICKSGIKFLETVCGKKPMVAQDIRQYQELIKQGETGFLAKTPDDWFNHLETLVLDKELRERMGQKAYDYVIKEHTIQGRIGEYADYFRELAAK